LLPRDLAEIATETLVDYLAEAGASDEQRRFGAELIEFARLRMTDIFENLSAVHTGMFSFDVARFAGEVRPSSLDEYRLAQPSEYRFALSDEQRRIISDFLAIYGSSVPGLSRILSKVYMRKIFRAAEALDHVEAAALSEKDAVIGDGQLTGLNQFT
jgi:hypothetical protein